MTYNSASTRSKGNPIAFPAAEGATSSAEIPTAEVPAAEIPAETSADISSAGTASRRSSVPDVAGGSDFAASAAMVNDILAAGPVTGTDADGGAPTHSGSGDTADGLGGPLASPDSVGGGSWGATTSADFFANTKPKPKRPFWHLELSFRRRKGSRSDRGRALPDA